MSVWSALYNYFRYKDSANWQCDDDRCELMEQQTTPSTLPNKHSVKEFSIKASVVSYLISCDDAVASPVLPFLSQSESTFLTVVDNPLHPLSLPPLPSFPLHATEEATRHFSAASSASATPTEVMAQRILSAIGRYCMQSLAANLLTHHLMPIVLHLAE